MSDQHQALREHLLELLRGGSAHLTFDDAVRDFPEPLRGKKPRGAAHSPWQLLEHMRLAQADILEFCLNPKYQEREFPAGYWPKSAAPASDAEWEKTARAFRSDLRKIEKLVEDPATDLFAPIRWGKGQTILREALLVADHNAYHLGQLVQLRKMLGAWEE